MTEFKRAVKDVQDYRETVRHARELGFEPKEFYFSGVWDLCGIKKNGNSTWSWLDNPRPSWPKSIREVGAKSSYFEIEMDGDVCRIEPGESDAALTITFKDR